MKISKLILSAFLISGMVAVSAVQAQPPADAQQNTIVDVQKSPNQLTMNTKKNAKNVTMTIKGPDGFYKQIYVGNSGMNMNVESNGDLADGVYHYEFTGTSDEPKKKTVKDGFNNGRGQAQKRSKKVQYEAISQSGFIRVKNGQIVTDEAADEPAFTGDNQ